VGKPQKREMFLQVQTGFAGYDSRINIQDVASGDWPTVFEFRVGLKLWVIFTLESGDVVLQTIGNHDQIKQFLRENF
jgi:hypothetical protein